MIKALLKDSIVYGFSKYLGVFASIFLMPIYTRQLTEADYGVMEFFNSINNLVIMILPLGLITSIFRYYPDYRDNPEEKRHHLGTILLVMLGMISLYTVAMIPFRSMFVDMLEFHQTGEIFYYSIGLVAGNILLSYFMTIAQSNYHKFSYLAISLNNMGLLIALGYIFVVEFRMEALGFFRASALALAVSLLIAIILYRKFIFFHFDKPVFKRLIKYSVHILSVGLLFNATNLLDRYILLEYKDLDHVGIYSIGMKIGNLLGLGTGAFAIAWFPRAMAMKSDEEQAKKNFKKVHNLFLVIAFFLLIAVTLFRKEILMIFAPGYDEAYNIIAIMSLFTVVNAMIYFYSLGLHIREKTAILTYAGIISIAINIASSLILLNFIGIDGVAWGTLIGGFVWVGIQLYFSQRWFHVSYQFHFFLIGCVIFTLASLLAPFLDKSFVGQLWPGIFIKTGIVVVFLAGLGAYFVRNYDVKSLLKRK